MIEVVPDSVLQAKNSKEKIKKWSEESGLPLKSGAINLDGVR